MKINNSSNLSSKTVRSALDLTRPLARSRQIVLVSECVDDFNSVYAGEEGRVYQILVNLISNAVKFTEPLGQITLTAGLTDTPDIEARLNRISVNPTGDLWTYIQVSDTDVSIPSAQLD